MGVKTLYFSMLRRFLEGRKDAPRRIREALDAGDLQEAELLVHSLRGLSGQIGATQVPEHAQALEQALHEEQPRAVLDTLLERLQAPLDELMAALETALPAAVAGP